MLDLLLSPEGSSLMGSIGLGAGFIFRQYAESRKANREFQLTALQAATGSMDRAAERTQVGGTWMRRALYGLMAFVFVAVIVAGFKGVPVVVEHEVTKGILFWKRVVTEFHTVDGVLFPPEIRAAFLQFIGFYLGQGIK